MVTVEGTNDAPVIDAIAQSDLTEQTDTDPLTTSIAVTFTDVDLTDVGHTATVTAAVTAGVTDGLALDEAGLIALVTPGAVTKNSGSDAGNVALAFSAASTVFDYLADGEVVTLTYTLDIDDGDGGLTQQDFVVTVTGTNDPPVVTAGGTLAWENGDGAKPIDGALTVSDIDSPMLIGGTVTITQGHDANDVLGFTTQNGISGSYNAGTGVLTLTGTATVEHYEDALRSVTFNTSGSPPSGANREVTFVVNDGDDDSVAATSTVTVSPAPPVTHNQIVGTENADTSLLGTAGSDIIFGMGGDDIINGGDADDIIIGGLGADNLTGGAGSDIFVFDDLLSVDTVLDFNSSADNILDPGEDIVDLEALLSGTFDPGTPGDEITFEDNAPDGVTLVVNGNPVANLNGVSDGEFVHVVHDQAEAAIAVQISLIS